MWLVALVAILFSSVNGDDHMTSRDDVHNIIAHRCCPSDACYPDQEALAALHHSLEGQLLLPSDSRYANESHMYNTLEQRLCYLGFTIVKLVTRKKSLFFLK